MGTDKKTIYKKWWFIAGVAIIIIAGISAGGGGGTDNNKSESSKEIKTEKKSTTITGTWYNEGPYGEVELRILSPDNFIHTVPTGEKYFGKWEKVYGNTYNLKYSDENEWSEGTEAILNGRTLDYQGGDRKKK